MNTTELKTLKDCPMWDEDRRRLKAEAVKWIKLRDEIIKAKKGIEDINQIELN